MKWNTAFEGVSGKQKILPEGEDDSEFPWETTMYCGFCNHVFCFYVGPWIVLNVMVCLKKSFKLRGFYLTY